MTARFTAHVAFSLAVAAVAAVGTGCTVHTYSGAAYPSTTYARSEPVRYEWSYRSSERAQERERGYVTRAEKRQVSRAPARTAREKAVAPARDKVIAREVVAGTAHEKAAPKPATSRKPVAVAAPRPENKGDEGDAVTLAPSEQKEKYGRVRSFEERLGEVFEQKKAKIAREKSEREARMKRAVGAATQEHL